jgi:hypothetical protein
LLRTPKVANLKFSASHKTPQPLYLATRTPDLTGHLNRIQLNKLQPSCGEDYHPGEEDTLFLSLDIRVSVESLLIPHRNIDDINVVFVGAKK